MAELAAIAADLERHLAWAGELGQDLPRDPPAPGRREAPRRPSAQFLPAAAVAAEEPSRAVRPASSRPSPPSAPASPASLDEVRAALGECTRCKLHGNRRHIVFGVGNPRAELVFVGEGPGPDEDARGEPFVGAAGQLLDKMIAAMGLRRSEVYICNVVKCLPPFRPPNSRFPEGDEIAACAPFLHAQLAAIRPRVIVALGKCAAQTLLDSRVPISLLRGEWHEYRGVKLMPTFHPAYLLRSPQEKRKAWEDLKKVMKEIPGPGAGHGA